MAKFKAFLLFSRQYQTMKNKSPFYLLLLAFALISSLHAQSRREYRHYLQNNSIEIKDSGTQWDSVFDSSFYANNFFWVGETHGIRYSSEVEWIILTHVHKKTGFKYVLLEAGFSSEIYLSRYFKTGDEKYLNMLFSSIKGVMGCTIENFEYYRKLYRYNLKLPDEKKLECVSIDIEHQYKEADNHVRSLLQKHDMPGDTSDFIHVFLHTGDDYKNVYARLFEDIQADSAKYKLLLKSDYPTFWYMVRNINFLFLAKASANREKTRDSLMFENYKIRLTDHDFIRLKTFACFGSRHCYLDTLNSTRYIASFIDRSNPAIQSTTVLLGYSGCEMLLSKGYLSKHKQTPLKEYDKYVVLTYDNDPKNIYRRSSKGDYTLFDIRNTDSIFYYKKDSLKPMRDYFHFIVLIKGSPAKIPYKK